VVGAAIAVVNSEPDFTANLATPPPTIPELRYRSDTGGALMADEARPFTKLYKSIWRDEEFTRLDGSAQRLYLLLISQPNVTLAGVLPLQPAKWARLAADATPETVLADVAALDESCFTVTDDHTEELLVRTYMRTAVLENKRPWTTQKGVMRHCLQVESPLIRATLADQLERCLHLLAQREDVNTEALDAIKQLRDQEI
jgi:hypothetical protein